MNKKYTMASFAMISLIAHLSVAYALGLLAPFDLTTSVFPIQAISIILKGPETYLPQPTGKAKNGVNAAHKQPALNLAAMAEKGHDSTETRVSRSELSSPTKENAPAQEPAQGASLSIEKQKAQDIPDEGPSKATPEKKVEDSHGNILLPASTAYRSYKEPVRTAGDFLATKAEKLTYRISLLKVPVGTAVMEATNIDGDLRITVKITSNAVISNIYPVDDLVETRMIKGNYLLTRVRQKEGSYRGDFGFTLMLREHKAFWIDRLANRYDYQSLPDDNVMDVVSGFYFLRNQDMEVGNSVQLKLFDSNEYSSTKVEVQRRERIGLPGAREVDTLVIHPLFKTAGFFRRTGDILIWLTDDEYRVPVRLETTITLGKVTAELISAESDSPISPPHRQSLSRR